MYREMTRKLNREELAVLNETVANTAPPITVRSTLKWFAIWASGILISAALAVWLVESFPKIGPVLAGIPGAIGVFCFLFLLLLLQGHFHWAANYRRFLRITRPSILEAIRLGTAKVKEVESKAVVVIEPSEDEGTGYVFDVGDGSLLFLKGQQYELVDKPAGWPNTRFSIVTTECGDIFVGIFCQGDKLEPVLEIDSKDCRPDVVWSTREDVIQGDLLEFSRSLIRTAND